MAAQPDLADACVYAVKADVEGYEAGPAFQGARAMFTGRCPPCLVFMEHQPAYTLAAMGDARHAFHVGVRVRVRAAGGQRRRGLYLGARTRF